MTIAAQTGVINDVPDHTTVLGYPAIPINKARRAMTLYTQLPELLERIRKLEQAVEELADAGETSLP